MSTITKAAIALKYIDEMGGSIVDLQAELSCAYREWLAADKSRGSNWQPNYRYGGRGFDLTRTLEDLTGADRAECEQAIRVALNDDWQSVKCREIVEFAERIRASTIVDKPPALRMQQHRAPSTSAPPRRVGRGYGA